MWDAIQREEAPSKRASEDDLTSLEAMFDITLADDHREFLLVFGEGVLFNHIRIFGTARIVEEAARFQERWREFFLWDGDGSALDGDALSRCVIVGDTFNGDEFVLSPAHTATLFYLPQDVPVISNLGTSLERALDRVIGELRGEVARYPEDEQEEWDLRPVFRVSSF